MTAPGRSIVMTGAGSGIGFAALRPLLAADPTVTLITLGRATAPGDGDARLAPIAAEFPTARLLHLRADLSSLRETDAAAAEIVRRVQSGELPAVGALICNAGVQRVDALTATAEGFEETFAVNVLSVAALIAGLGPALAPDARITVTASDTHFGDLRHNFGLVPAPDWRSARELARPGAFRDPQRVAAGRTAYSTSKLAVIHLVHELARILPVGIRILAFNPGFVPATGLIRNADAVSQLAVRTLMRLLTLTPLASRTSEAGAWLAACATGGLDAPTGSYVDRDQVVPSSPESYDPTRERQLRADVAALIAETLGR